jgi:hypothetical protein
MTKFQGSKKFQTKIKHYNAIEYFKIRTEKLTKILQLPTTEIGITTNP